MKQTFSIEHRRAEIDKLDGEAFDLVVIGGGITGAGVFRDASLRGLKTLLLEGEDFASGTSSKSSKLVHGGLRYLEHFHFGLTWESCRERELQLQINPHLVRPMPFLFPVYRGAKIPPSAVHLGLTFYDFLAGGTAIRHRMLKPEQTTSWAPTLNTQSLSKVALYYDSTADDARLVIANILSGRQAGGIALNYAAVTGFLRDSGQITNVKLRDQESQKDLVVGAKKVVNATGIHCDVVRAMAGYKGKSELRASKGIHLVVDREKVPLQATLAFRHPDDRRAMFAIPWYNRVLVGSTDTFEDGDVRDTNSDDVDYTLRALRETFRGSWERSDIGSSFAGVRTLVMPGDKDKKASAVSREHKIYTDPNGMISIAGGKLTTFRIMGKNIVDLVVAGLPQSKQMALSACSTETRPLQQVVDVTAAESELMTHRGFTQSVAEHLVRTYGSQVQILLNSADGDPSQLQPLVPGSHFLRCEIPYMCANECVVHLDDLLTRRLRVALWAPGQAHQQAREVARLASEVLGWNQQRQQEETDRYRAKLRQEFQPV